MCGTPVEGNRHVIPELTFLSSCYITLYFLVYETGLMGLEAEYTDRQWLDHI